MYLGIDLGTSGVKTILMEGTGKVLDQAQAPLRVSRPLPLWSEQDPDAWWQAADTAVQTLRHGRNDFGRVKAIGLSGQMHGATLLDLKGISLRPAILWNDGRSGEQCRQLEQLVPDARKITGNLAMPGFTAPKLLWLKQHEPEIFKKIHKVLLPKDYLRLCMTGDYASDMSDSAGTLWMSTGTRNWSESMLNACGLTKEQMPQLYEGPEPTGILRPVIAQQWGLGSVSVVAGGGDNAAGAVGAGVVNPGEGMISLGTSGVYFVVSAVHSFCHALPERWHLMSVMLSAAVCLEWLQGLTNANSVTQLLNEVEKKDPTKTTGDLIFLPYLSGERTPHNNPHARGVFFGLTHNHDRADLTMAVLEGVSFGLLDGQLAMQETGSKTETLTLIGGGARSQLWRQLLANILNKNIEYRDGGNVGPALGAARLAALGMARSNCDAVMPRICAKPTLLETAEPELDKVEHYQAVHHSYQKLYQQLNELF